MKTIWLLMQIYLAGVSANGIPVMHSRGYRTFDACHAQEIKMRFLYKRDGMVAKCVPVQYFAR